MGESRADVAAIAGRAFSSLRPPSTMDAAVSALREAIIRGEIPPGSRLVESALTESMGVSRNTIREVLRLLETEKLITRVTNRGVVVRQLTPADVSDVYAVRRLVEVSALRLSGEVEPRLRSSCLAAMREAVDAGSEALRSGDKWAAGYADLQFHAAIAELSSSPRLIEFMSGLKTELRLAFASADDVLDFHNPYVRRNAIICGLFAEGQFDAAADELLSYLYEGERDLLSRLDAPQIDLEGAFAAGTPDAESGSGLRDRR